MVNGEGAKVVVDANAGLTCPAESPQELVKNILIMKNMDAKEISALGLNARYYYEVNFEREHLFDRVEKIFESMCKTF